MAGQDVTPANFDFQKSIQLKKSRNNNNSFQSLAGKCLKINKLIIFFYNLKRFFYKWYFSYFNKY